MDIRTLRYFVAVHEEQSVSGAAKRCFVAQPSISTAISQLENRLGVSLFLRHHKGVTPTPEGRTFYQSATRLLGEFDALGGLFETEDKRRPLDIAIMPTIDAKRLREFLKRIVADEHRIALRIVEERQQADARIISDRLRSKTEEFVHIWDEEYVLALPQSHRLSLQPKLTLSDLQGLRFIERCLCEVHDEVSGLLARNKISTQVVARAHNEEWAVALVAAGVGAALVPEGSVTDGESVAIRRIEELQLVRRVGVAFDPTGTPSAGLQALIEVLHNLP